MTTVQMLLLKNLMEPLLMVKKSKLTVPEVAEVAIAETATEAIVAAAEVAIAETATEAIGVAVAEAIAVAAEVGMEAMVVGTREAMVEAMTKDPIKRILL